MYPQFTSTLTPDEDGDWELGLVISGRGTMFLDGKPIIDLTNPTQGDAFFGIGTAEVRHVVPLQKGKEYNVDIRICNAEFIERGTPFSCRGGIRLGAIRNVDLDVAMNEAVDAAKAADVAVLVIGLNNDWESEGHDREHMEYVVSPAHRLWLLLIYDLTASLAAPMSLCQKSSLPTLTPSS